jgi:predicted MFS family arabinose efflux permease
MAYLGDEQLAIAALADVGNKFFGLILLFLVATYWYRKRSIKNNNASTQEKLKDLGLSLISEPINLVIVVAIILLVGGFTLDQLPIVLQSTIKKFSVIMVPLILLFIGLSVHINRSEFGNMIQLLSWRSGVAFLLSGFALLLFPTLSIPMALVLIAFPQSSCSFWPFAHMCTVSQAEEIEGQQVPTFDLRFAINMLACSLPFSTMVIISIFYVGDVIVNPVIILSIGIVLIIGAISPKLLPDGIRSGLLRRQTGVLERSPLKH